MILHKGAIYLDRITGTFQLNHHIMEYSVTGGGAETVLLLHGGHSNSNETFGVKMLVDGGYAVLIPSRPGYGKTSKGIGDSLAETAEYYIGLLNHLSIDKVHLIAISTGGASGIYMASKYPGRIKSLILQSAVTQEWLRPDDSLYKIARVAFRSPVEKVTWRLLSTMNNLFPETVFRFMAPSFSTLSNKVILDKMADNDIEEIRLMNNRQSSGQGFLIDLAATKEITAAALQEVRCPALIIHSRNDASVPLEHAYFAHDNIPDSTLIVTESWGHIIWLGKEAEETDELVTEFLENNR